MPLNEILKQIRDKRTEIEARHAAVRENRPVSAVIEQRPIESLDELIGMSTDYYQHQFKHAVLQDPNAPDLPEDLVREDVREVLERKYGSLRQALMAVRYGVDGGTLGVIQNLYLSIIDTHVRALQRYIIETNAPPVDWDAKVALAREFLRSLSCVVPKEQQVRAEEIAPCLEEIIEKHIERTSFSKKSSGR